MALVLEIIDQYDDTVEVRCIRRRVLEAANPSEPTPKVTGDVVLEENPGCICREMAKTVCPIHRGDVRPWEVAKALASL